MLPSLSFDQDEIPLVSLSCCIYRGDASGKLSQLLRLNSRNSIAKHYSPSSSRKQKWRLTMFDLTACPQGHTPPFPNSTSNYAD